MCHVLRLLFCLSLLGTGAVRCAELWTNQAGQVIEARLDPIQGLMTRKLKLKGDMLQVMRYPKAAKDMVGCVLRVPSDFGSTPSTTLQIKEQG